MSERLVHRGPDACGEYADERVALGCRRLSIVDVEGGGQPFLNEDGSVVLVCNGEIFNHRELRQRLTGRHRFRSACDVEVIVHLYEEHGAALVDDLRGQFSFVLYDRLRQRLLLARDHFGICPLYYCHHEDQLIFASEARAILIWPGIGCDLDLQGLDSALSLPSVVSPRTMFRGVQSLPAGQYLEFDPERLVRREYWDLVYPTLDESACEERPVPPDEAIVATLRRAVRGRLQSESPIGLYVSGGLDSALVARLAVGEADPNVTRTLSVGFPQRELDETRYRQLVTDGLGLPHTHVQVTVDDIVTHLERAVLHSEVPLRESYNVASLMLSAAAGASGAKVILSGEGSDELFAGYAGYRFDAYRAGRTAAARSAPADPDELEARAAMWGDPSYGYDIDVAELREVKGRLYSEELLAVRPQFDCTREAVVDGGRVRGRHLMHKRSYLDVKLRLGDHLLGDHGDRMTMANSVEGRYPFLDLDVVRLSMDIPPELKLRDLEEKFVLKRAARGLVPATVVDREKFPFTAPGAAYLVREARDFVGDWLSPDLVRRHGLFNPAEVERLVAGCRDPAHRPSTPVRTEWLMLILTTTMLHELSSRT